MSKSVNVSKYLLFHASFKQVDSLKSKNSKYNGTSINCSEGIAKGDDDSVLDTVLLRVVVGSKTDNWSKSQTKRVEDLISSIQPYCGLQQHVHLGCEHVNESFSRTLEGDASEEEDGEDEVGEESCEVDNLARACNSWNQNW